jgi:hypothetical protein
MSGWQADAARAVARGDMQGAAALMVEKVDSDAAARALDVYRKSLFDCLDAGSIDDAQTVVAAFIETKVEQGCSRKQARSDVKASVTSRYKQAYRDADAVENAEKMQEIENLLLRLGLGFALSDFRRWLAE